MIWETRVKTKKEKKMKKRKIIEKKKEKNGNSEPCYAPF